MTTAFFRLLPLALVALVFGAALPTASAQLQVSLQMNRTHYVAYEPVLATVTIVNRAGKDVVLGGAEGKNWLTFNIDQIGGNAVLPYAGEPNLPARVVSAGQTIRETISLGRYYPLGALGNYSARANVYFAEFGQFMASNVRSFAVTEGNLLWKDQIGISQRGKPTSYRQMSLLSFQEESQLSLYVRIREEQTNRVLATYNLGRLVLQRDPQAAIDGDNRLNVFFLTGPKLYRHIVIDPAGVKLSEEIYESRDSNFPELKIADTGRVRVAGGVPYDPNRQAANREVIHRLSERPPGVPDEKVED